MSTQYDQIIENTTKEIFKICLNGDKSIRLFYKQNKELLSISKIHLFMNRACTKNHVSIIKYILDQPKLDLVYINYVKMLDIARRNENKEILDLLRLKAEKMDMTKIIQNDIIADFIFIKEIGIEISNEKILATIVFNGINIVRYLISIDFPIIKGFFYCAITFHQNEIFEMLMSSSKEDPDLYSDCVDKAIEVGNLYVLKYCLEHINSNTVISADYISSLVAVLIQEEELELEMLEYLLEKYSNLKIEIHHTLFCNLINNQQEEILNILSDYHIQATYEQINFAISLDNLEVCIILLSAYEPHIPEDLKYNCIAYACMINNMDIIRYIIEEECFRETFFDEFVEIAYTFENYNIAYYFIDEHLNNIEYPIDQQTQNNIRSIVLKFKPQLPFIDKVPEHTECGICTLELSTGENILNCSVCKNLTHSECYSKWGKSCVYCRN